MELTCKDAAPLVPSYLDGELTEPQAAPLRQHLLGCVACREVAKDAKALSAWFEPGSAVQAPEGFAARVARRAFAGDLGEGPVAAPEQVEPPARVQPAVPPGTATAGAQPEEGALLSFVLRLTAAAAVLLLTLAAAIQFGDRPATGEDLRADWDDMSLEERYGLDDPAMEEAERRRTAPRGGRPTEDR
ncbi:MAG: zf-HC2 domain-containing protein [Planctomycetota bacterium]